MRFARIVKICRIGDKENCLLMSAVKSVNTSGLSVQTTEMTVYCSNDTELLIVIISTPCHSMECEGNKYVFGLFECLLLLSVIQSYAHCFQEK